jgi:hypothetical protein
VCGVLEAEEDMGEGPCYPGSRTPGLYGVLFPQGDLGVLRRAVWVGLRKGREREGDVFLRRAREKCRVWCRVFLMFLRWARLESP